MSLTVLTGRPGSGTTALVYDAVRAAVAQGLRTVLLLPTLPDVRRARSALSASCPIGLDVGQLDRLVETQWALHGDGRLLVGGVERRALLARAWSEVAPGAHAGDGLLDLLGALARRSSEQDPHRPAEEPRDAEAGRLVRAVGLYRGLLDRAGLVEPGEAARVLACRSIAPADLVVAHRFTDLGPAQEAVLHSWARSARVIVTLPYDLSVPATVAVEGLVSRLRDAGGAVRPIAAVPGGDTELAALESRLFATGERVEPRGEVVLGVAQGAECEARLAAHHVLAALAEGTPPDRIAVAFRDPARHYHWLRRVFEEEGIAADYDVSLPAGEAPFGRAFLRLWAFAAGGFSRVDLVAFLRSPYAGTPAAVVDAADERWRASRTKDGPGLLQALGREAPGAALAAAARALCRAPIDTETAKKWKQLADRLFANGYQKGTSGAEGRVTVDAAAHRAFVSALDALCAVEGSTPEQAIDALRLATVSQSQLERPGHVQVMGADRLRSRRFDVVVLGGLTASEFPRRGMGDSLEGDAVQAAMRALGVTYDQGEELAKERLLFYLSVTRARRRLALIRQESDGEGRPVRRSVFWDELLDVYRDPSDPDDLRGPDVGELLVEQIVGAGPSSRPCTRRGLVADGAVAAELAAIDAVGASEIEAYLSCPYSWFVERVLRPDRPDVDIDGRMRGALAHDALRRFYETLEPATGSRRVTPGNLATALELAAEAVRRTLASAPPAHSLEEGQALSTIERSVRRLVERDASFLPGYEPVAHEWAFGRCDEEAVDLGSFRLKGRVDRIDMGPDGLVVIDYKASSATPMARFEDEGKVQLQLYALAAGRRFDRGVAGGLYRSLATAADRGFMSADYSGPGIVRTDVLEAGAIGGLLSAAVERASAAVAGMRAGAISPRPETRRCSYCVASGFCEEALR